MPSRNVDAPHDPRDRFGLYRLCDCTACAGRGKAYDEDAHTSSNLRPRKCPDCRGEGRVRQEVASCANAEAVGVALVTLAREGEFENCRFGLLDRDGEKGKRWLILPWPETARTVRAAAQTLARSKKSSQS